MRSLLLSEREQSLAREAEHRAREERLIKEAREEVVRQGRVEGERVMKEAAAMVEQAAMQADMSLKAALAQKDEQARL